MLLYTKELVAPRPTPGLGLLKFKKQKYKKFVRHSLAHSTVHGLQHVFEEEEERHVWLRYFWLIIVASSSIGCFAIYSLLEHRHDEQQLVSIIETTQLPVYSIEFPAVAICPWNHVNWARAQAAALRFLPANPDNDLLQGFHQLLVLMEQANFGSFDKLDELSTRNLTELINLSLTKLSSYLAYRCDELFVPDSCIFDETPFDCCKLFVQEHTEKGLCLVFNSMISKNSRQKQLTNNFYPFKLSTAGEGTGLQFTLHLNDSFLRPGTIIHRIPFAMNLMIKEPRQWTQQMANVFHLYADTENFVAVNPTVFETTPSTNQMKLRQRRCYFDYERKPYYPETDLAYSRENCIAVCLHHAVLRVCKCSTPGFFPPIEGTRECSVLDAKCLAQNADIFSYVKMRDQDKYINDSRRGQLCHCPENCNSRQYKLTLNVRNINYDANETRKLIKTQVFYGQRVMTKIVTKLRYTTLDLLANFGGILGLYMGASALSFIEVGYFLVKLLWMLLKDGYLKIKTKLVN
ncbi:pickpocket protein 19-like [Drosophila tropicalis]|uniref:pickpocket protein 19-like n=1 Tax=Drosophila tropicalis TaxID=46794 RepID=UPI0035AB6DE2